MSSERPVSPFDIKAADKLAFEVLKLTQQGKLGSRSAAGDALLNYASSRFGDSDPLGKLEEKVKSYK